MNLLSKEKFISIFLFALFWLCGGFFLGSFALLGPVEWLAAWGRGIGWSQTTEDWVVRIIILLLIGGTGYLSYKIVRVLRHMANKTLQGVVILVGCLTGLLAFWMWLSPDFVNQYRYGIVSSSAKFTVGAYPTLDRLRELKRKETTTIIPLLHPTLIPFEGKLLDDVKKGAEIVGLEVISAPMLPWVSSNAAALKIIKDLALNGKGRYYIHCYLGRDRVYVVKNMLERLGQRVASELPEKIISAENMERFERGKIIRVSRNVVIAPYPTPEEFFAHILRGNVRQIVCLLDPADPDARKLIEWEEKELKKYAFPFIHLPISLHPFRPDEALQAARAVKKLTGITVVHAYYSNNTSPPVAAFLQAFRSDKPPTLPARP